MKMIFDKTICNESDAETTVVAYSNVYVLRRVDISGIDNQYLMYALNAFYKDFNDLKKASVLWNVVSWSNNPEMRYNDNRFVFNIMLGYNTSFHDNETNDWYWDEVNQKAATSYIKFSKRHFDNIQPIRPDNDDNIVTKGNDIIIPRAKFILSAPVLEGIVKRIIPLCIYVIQKVQVLRQFILQITNQRKTVNFISRQTVEST